LATARIYFKCCELLIEKQPKPKIIEISDDEIAAFNIVKQILKNYKIDCEQICYSLTSSFLSINYSMTYQRWFLRIKLSGKKKYVVTEFDIKSIKNIVGDLAVEECPKSISGQSRVLINSVDDIKKLDKLIV
jgi:DNA polymerase-3 subunit epsilon